MAAEEVMALPVSRTDTRVQCPFYQYDQCIPKRRILRIICEGLVDSSSLMLNYRHLSDFTIQMENFCCRYYDRCEVYRMLMEKYEDV